MNFPQKENEIGSARTNISVLSETAGPCTYSAPPVPCNFHPRPWMIYALINDETPGYVGVEAPTVRFTSEPWPWQGWVFVVDKISRL